MDIREINVFSTVCKYLNISKAADFLGVSQPSLSREIKALEEELGAKLFLRLPRGLKLTEEGAVYQRGFNKIIRELKNTEMNAKGLRDGLHGHYKISVHPILGRHIIPEFEARMSTLSGISIEYSFENSRDAVESVMKFESDIAIVADVKAYPDIVKIKLWDEFIGLYSRDGAERETILYNSLMIHAQRILARYPRCITRKLNDYNVLYSVLKGNNFMGLLPNQVEESVGGLVLIKRFRPNVEISLIFRSDKLRTKGVNKVIALLKEVGKAL